MNSMIFGMSRMIHRGRAPSSLALCLAAVACGGSGGSSGAGGFGGSLSTASTSTSGSTTSSSTSTSTTTTSSTSTTTTSSTSTTTTSSSSSSTSSSSGSSPVTGPCDLYAAGGAPCVAAHSTVRALYGDYDGNLYQVTRASDKTTKDVGVLVAGGFADSATQDTFCAGTTCTISILYDQSPKGNHLRSAPGGGAVPNPDTAANATALKLTVGGHTVYGLHVTPGTGYRDDATAGIATGDEPETEYMVTSGNFYNNGCCFDYGNAETNNHDDGAATMEAVYFGTGVVWGTGNGTGPWVEADLENGLFAGGATGKVMSNTSLTSAYVTAMVVGRSGSFALKGGDAQSGTLTTMYDGARPSGYNPMKKQGAIILGIGGDNSNGSQGNFFEGVMTSGNAPSAVDEAVHANIIAAGYGH